MYLVGQMKWRRAADGYQWGRIHRDNSIGRRHWRRVQDLINTALDHHRGRSDGA
jgi:hypothetical protein